jgi:hypothetical protein
MDEQNDLFDRKHLKLWRISSAADFLSYVVIVVFIFLSLGEIYRYNQMARSLFSTNNLIGLISRQPIFILDVLLQMVRVLLQGAVYYLVLKGVALGINMIVETDINYREKSVDEGVE